MCHAVDKRRLKIMIKNNIMQPSTNVVAATYRKLQIWGLWYFEKMANFLWEVFTYGVSTDYD